MQTTIIPQLTTDSGLHVLHYAIFVLMCHFKALHFFALHSGFPLHSFDI